MIRPGSRRAVGDGGGVRVRVAEDQSINPGVISSSPSASFRRCGCRGLMTVDAGEVGEIRQGRRPCTVAYLASWECHESSPAMKSNGKEGGTE